MPVGVEARCERTLDDVLTVSQSIRRSASACANRQNSSISDRLRRQLETIRVSADTILEAFTKASFTGANTLDERIIDWLLSGELPMCLGKLKQMDDILKHNGQVRPTQAPARLLGQVEDKLAAAMAFFDKHSSLFHFLLTPDVWNREIRHQASEASRVNTTCITDDHQGTQTTEESESEYHTASEPEDDGDDTNQARTTRYKQEFIKEKLNEVSRRLAPLNCTEKHSDILKLRQEGTCTWFSETEVYKKWRLGGNRFLWLHGKAGCGKSVLVASTIEHLTSTLQEEEVVIYFYCDFRNERSTSPTEVIRSLLSQLMGHFHDCGLDPGDLPIKILEQKSQGTLSLNDLDKLCDLVWHAASCFRYEPIIVIDALDECADIDALLRALVTLNLADVRVLVTSRPHEMIMDHIGGFRSLSFENVTKEMAGDIALHVRREVDSHNRLRSADLELKNELQVKLNEKAEGRFRWVQCQIDALKRCTTRQELREALDNLPNELEATYERILGAIDERKSEGSLARRALVWLSVALEPLHLAHIVDGLSMNPNHQKVNRETLGSALLHALSSLVSYSEETDIVIISHFSVMEYLTIHTPLPTYQIVTHEAHAEVARMCMCCISVILNPDPSCGDVAPFSPLHCVQMLSYVFSSGFSHLAHVDPGSTVVLEALQSLGSDVRHYPSHWERLCELRDELLRWPYPPWPSPRHDFVPYILIAYSSPGLLRSFFSRCLSLKPRAGTNPLVYAADLHKTEHAMVLLGSGADVNLLGFVVDDSRHALPLEIAIDLGEDVLVGELLRRGCLVPSELIATAICMPWCSIRVLAKLMQNDMFAEWAHLIGEEKLYRSVFNSARPSGGDSRTTDEDHVALARILRQIGLDLSPNSPFGVELIERAVYAAHTSMLEFLLPPDQPPPPRFLLAASTGDTSETVSVVRFLLSKGVDIHTGVSCGGGLGDTALHLAVMCPWEPRALELAEILIKAGCDPAGCNSAGRTILQAAIERGHTSVVELLLSYHIQFPPNILRIMHRLQKRLSSEMVEYLLRKGADPFKSGKKRALLIAIRSVTGSEYSDLPRLPFAHRDARELRDHLIDSHGYQPDDVILMLDDKNHPKDLWPTRQRILHQINQLTRDVPEDSHFFFYFSGQALQQECCERASMRANGLDSMIITADGKVILDHTLHNRLITPLNKVKDLKLFALFDCCYSESLLDLETGKTPNSYSRVWKIGRGQLFKVQLMKKHRRSVQATRRKSILGKNEATSEDRQIENLSVICLSPCRDTQLAHDDHERELTFTRCFLNAVSEKPNITWTELLDTLKEAVRDIWTRYQDVYWTQEPRISTNWFTDLTQVVTETI